MLLALALLVMGGTVLFAGPVQAVVVNFNLVGETTTTMDSLLCPNRTYTFSCEINNTLVQLRSFDNDDGVVDTFDIAAGETSSQSEFVFAAMSSMSGLIGTAITDSSTGLMSVRLVCTDLIDEDYSSLSTIVKHPLDGPNPDSLDVTCVFSDDNVMFIGVTWDLVDCAQLYVLKIYDIDYDIDSITTSETSHQSLYSGSATNISVSLSAVGGPVLLHSEECIELSIPTSATLTTTMPTPTTSTRTPTPTPDACGFDAIPVSESSCCGETRIGYDLSFINFPAGGRAYYQTSDGSDVDITITDGDATIFFDATVTVYVVYENGTECYSQELEAPSGSGGNSCCTWLILAVVFGVFGVLAIVFAALSACACGVVVKKHSGESKIANQGKSRDSVNLDPDVTEMKTRGSDM